MMMAFILAETKFRGSKTLQERADVFRGSKLQERPAQAGLLGCLRRLVVSLN
jgi:hypothetical protein